MIRSIRVENYKSIVDLKLELGQVNILIGANGTGKSNILEAIALGSAAAQHKLENEFLATRGIRVSETRFMRSSFDEAHQSEDIEISIHGDDGVDFRCDLDLGKNSSYPKWAMSLTTMWKDIIDHEKARGKIPGTFTDVDLERIIREKYGTLPGFLVYAPENSALRTFQAEGQILPLGIKGEGLFAHLKALNADAFRDRLPKIKERLALMDWFETFEIPANLSPGERSIQIRDRYLAKGAWFDQRVANEGFLFLLFYLTLFISPDTPAFFSIDNVDSSLNPKLCTVLLQQLVELAKEYDKQVIFTTHNPAILDGLDITDDEQRLFVVDRTKRGHTRVRRVDPPKQLNGRPPVNLSEAFMRGYFGGLPQNF